MSQCIRAFSLVLIPLFFLAIGSLADRASEPALDVEALSAETRQVAAAIRDRAAGEWTEDQILRLADHVVRLSRRYKFKPALVLSVIEVESRFNRDAISHKGAIGLMQLMPATAKELAQKLSLPWHGDHSARDPKMNLELALHYLQELRSRYRDPQHYLTAYNQGPNRVDAMIRTGQSLPNGYYNKVVKTFRSYNSRRAF